jgi:predicted SnoaL-like aldol condensation-catalyzing enzyme
VNLKSLSGGLMVMASIAPMLAQSGSSINPLTTFQTAPMNVSEQQNLNMVLQLWREVIQAHHTELAEKYLAEDYIQHNPNVPTGRAAFLKVFSTVPPTNPIPEKLTRPPVVEGARGDFVWLVFENEAKLSLRTGSIPPLTWINFLETRTDTSRVERLLVQDEVNNLQHMINEFRTVWAPYFLNDPPELLDRATQMFEEKASGKIQLDKDWKYGLLIDDLIARVHDFDPGAGVVVSPGLRLGPNAVTGDEYLRVELAAVEISRSGLAGRRTQLKNL